MAVLDPVDLCLEFAGKAVACSVMVTAVVITQLPFEGQGTFDGSVQRAGLSRRLSEARPGGEQTGLEPGGSTASTADLPLSGNCHGG
jgi:hypothetical protein